MQVFGEHLPANISHLRKTAQHGSRVSYGGGGGGGGVSMWWF